MLNRAYQAAALQAFHDRETPATMLHCILLDCFETAEYVNWDPETVRREFPVLFNASWDKVPRVNRDKVHVLCANVLSTNNFFRSLPAFIPTCNALSNTHIRLDIFDPATVEEMHWAVTETQLLGVDDEYGLQIKEWVGIQAGVEGFDKLPKLLSWGNKPNGRADRLEAAAVDADMFAAGFREGQDKIKTVEAKSQARAQALLEALAKFPFMNRVGEDLAS